jgi:hypothetical protein
MFDDSDLSHGGLFLRSIQILDGRAARART